MYNDEHPHRRFLALSPEDDAITTIKTGSLIPQSQRLMAKHPSSPRTTGPLLLPGAALAVALLASVLSYQAVSSQEQLAAPIVVVEHPYTHTQTALQYGTEVTLAEPQFFAETRNAFIAEEVSFIAVDLDRMQVEFFDDGVLLFQSPIVRKGEVGSWCETPAGLYEVTSLEQDRSSVMARAQFSHYIAFANNYAIHGPLSAVDDTETVSGCVELSGEDAAVLFQYATKRMPVLVHEKKSTQDSFVYAPKVPELDTRHYLLADVNNSTVLASTALYEPAPIASLTKLMTALVAIEEIDLESTIPVVEDSLIASLIPRLGNQSNVSLYSLLQLLLVESSNEAAEIIAHQVGRERFVERMNERAADLGMANTKFADPSGISNENVSSLADLMRLTQYIYTNRRIIFALTADQNAPTVYTGGAFGQLVNFNTVAGLDNFIGGKVGETKAAGQTSVTLHTLTIGGQERVMVIVLLGSDSRSADVTELLEYAKMRFAD